MKKNISLTMLLILAISVLAPLSAIALDQTEIVGQSNVIPVADVLAAAGITQDERAELGVMQAHIASLLYSGQISVEEARFIVNQLLYPESTELNKNPEQVYTDDDVWGFRIHPEARLYPSTNAGSGGKNPSIASVGTNIDNLPFWNGELVHMYYQLEGSTARANGSDYYEITYIVQGPGSAFRPSAKLEFIGTAGLIIDTVGISDQNGIITVKVYATKPGVYALSARTDPDMNSIQSVSMEFVSPNISLPTPTRLVGRIWDHPPMEWDSPVPESVENPSLIAPVPGKIDRAYSLLDFYLPAGELDGVSMAAFKFYANNNNYNRVSGDVYLTTSFGADFWLGDDAWIIADGERLSETVGQGISKYFVLSVKGDVEVQFFSRTPMDFNVAVGVDQARAADGTLWKYSCGNATAQEASAVPAWRNNIKIGLIEISLAASAQENPVSAKLPVPEKAQVQINSGSDSVRFNYFTIMPGGVNRRAFLDMLAEMASTDHLLIYASEHWYDVSGVTFTEAVSNGRTTEANVDYVAVLDNGTEVSAAIGSFVDEVTVLTSFDAEVLQPYYEMYNALSASEKASVNDLPIIQELLSVMNK